MFGLEKKRKKPFEFDLQKELKKTKRKKEILDLVGTKSQSLKEALRTGEASENFDQCGVILQGYVALAKVVNRTEGN